MRVGLYLLSGAGILTLNLILGLAFSTSTLAQIIQILIIDAIVFGLAFILYKHRPGKKKHIKFTVKPVLLSIGGMLGTWLAAQSITRLIVTKKDIAYEVVNQSVFQVNPLDNPLLILSLILSATFSLVAAPLSEEFLYRGVFYHGIAEWKFFKSPITRIGFATITSAVIFGTVHMNATQFVSALIMALYICIIYEYTHSIWYSVILHGIYNIIGYLFNITGNDLPLSGYTALIGIGIAVTCLIILLWEKIAKNK